MKIYTKCFLDNFKFCDTCHVIKQNFWFSQNLLHNIYIQIVCFWTDFFLDYRTFILKIWCLFYLVLSVEYIFLFFTFALPTSFRSCKCNVCYGPWWWFSPWNLGQWYRRRPVRLCLFPCWCHCLLPHATFDFPFLMFASFQSWMYATTAFVRHCVLFKKGRN